MMWIVVTEDALTDFDVGNFFENEEVRLGK